MTTIALATYSKLPELHADDAVLVRALKRRGLRVMKQVWDAPVATPPDAWMLRSVWDYHHRVDEFLAWVARTGEMVPFWNDPELVRWNSNKEYLSELATRGAMVVPTLWIGRGESTDLAAQLEDRGWDDVVIKPAVSASAHKTARFKTKDFDAGSRHLAGITATGSAMVQQYQVSVEDYGERSLIYADGEFTHAVRRRPVLSEGHETEELAPLVEPTRDEMNAGWGVVAGLTEKPLYARVDLVADEDGVPLIMELELIEPRLYLREGPKAADRIADRIAERLGVSDRRNGGHETGG